MLPKVRRVSSILRNRQDSFPTNSKVMPSGERLSYKSSSSSSKSTEDGNNGMLNYSKTMETCIRVQLPEYLIKLCLVYIETLLYIVHVDNIDVSVPDDPSEIVPTNDDGQLSISSNPLIRRMSKRTIASFNERHYQPQENSQTSLEPIYARPSLNFSNPLRRLNSNN